MKKFQIIKKKYFEIENEINNLLIQASLIKMFNKPSDIIKKLILKLNPTHLKINF